MYIFFFINLFIFFFFFFSSRRRHTRYIGDWSSDVCSSDLGNTSTAGAPRRKRISREMARNSSVHSPAVVWKFGECHSMIVLKIRCFSCTARGKVSSRKPRRSEERRVGKEWGEGWAGGCQ